jgi:uncharacterized membrane protein
VHSISNTLRRILVTIGIRRDPKLIEQADSQQAELDRLLGYVREADAEASS